MVSEIDTMLYQNDSNKKCNDISELRSLTSTLNASALTFEVTLLPNRTLFCPVEDTKHLLRNSKNSNQLTSNFSEANNEVQPLDHCLISSKGRSSCESLVGYSLIDKSMNNPLTGTGYINLDNDLSKCAEEPKYESAYISKKIQLWQPFAKWLHWWFCNTKYTPMAQIIVAFVWGVLLSPWSSGLFFLTIFIIIYEILYYVFTHGDPRYYNLFVRTGVIYSSIFGYILGRTLSGDNVLQEGVPSMPGSQ
ncbi:Hypothetical protein HVR_LOCUS185 [uncultured virus]|nr:Hypothetical protein HVR_LOCUS185 [uncultured virus]